MLPYTPRMLNALLRTVFLALAATTAAPSLHAQGDGAKKLEFPAASPSATVKQRFGVTDVEIEYARPSVKGRKIFGDLVPHGEVWRTGANSATKVTFSTDVKFGGSDVPAGTYALFTIPELHEWTVILNKVAGQWGSYAYDAKNDQVRVKAKPVALNDAVETLEIGLANLANSSATFHVSWDKVRVPVKVETDLVALLVPRIEAAMAGEGEKPYFPAAMFYFENGLDLKKASAWIDAAATADPDAFWITYRKGLILEKMGDKPGAIAAAQASLDQASKAKGEIKDEYTRLNKALLARLK